MAPDLTEPGWCGHDGRARRLVNALSRAARHGHAARSVPSRHRGRRSCSGFLPPQLLRC